MLSITKKVIFLPLEIISTEKDKKHRLNSLMRKIIIIIGAVFFTQISFAQTIEIGGFVGTSYYLGELNPAMPYNQTQLAYGALARYNLNERWAVKFSYYRGDVQGSDATGGWVEDRGLDFKSKINDFSLVAEFNFWEYFTGSKKSFFTPFIFGGASFFTFNPISYSGVILQPEGTEGQNDGFDGRSPYNKYSFAIPFGFGFKYSLTERLGITFEWGMRKTFTDYIDDISTTYANDPDIIADPTQTHSAYMQRGDDQTMDWYNYTGVTFTYKFDLRNKKGCSNVEWK